MATNPFKVPEPDARGSASIGKAVKIVGQIFSKEDLYVDGDVEGTIELAENKLTIGPSGRVQAGTRPAKSSYSGRSKETWKRWTSSTSARMPKLVGDIKTARIIIEDGAYFKGSIDIVKHGGKEACRGTSDRHFSSGSPSIQLGLAHEVIGKAVSDSARLISIL